jgi:hypothetical protein
MLEAQSSSHDRITQTFCVNDSSTLCWAPISDWMIRPRLRYSFEIRPQCDWSKKLTFGPGSSNSYNLQIPIGYTKGPGPFSHTDVAHNPHLIIWSRQVLSLELSRAGTNVSTKVLPSPILFNKTERLNGFPSRGSDDFRTVTVMEPLRNRESIGEAPWTDSYCLSDQRSSNHNKTGEKSDSKLEEKCRFILCWALGPVLESCFTILH